MNGGIIMRLKISLKDGSSKEIFLKKIDIIPVSDKISNAPVPVNINLNGFDNNCSLSMSSSIVPDIESLDKIEIIE